MLRWTEICGYSQYRACWLHTVWAFTGWALLAPYCVVLHRQDLLAPYHVGLHRLGFLAPYCAGLHRLDLLAPYSTPHLDAWQGGGKLIQNEPLAGLLRETIQVSFDVKFIMKVHTCTVPHLAGLLKQEQKDQTSAMILGNLISAKCR